jgi:hypothetical protein
MHAYRKGLDFVVTPCGLSLSHDKFFVCRFGSEGNAVFAAVMIHNEGETNNGVGLKTEQCMLQYCPITLHIAKCFLYLQSGFIT